MAANINCDFVFLFFFLFFWGFFVVEERLEEEILKRINRRVVVEEMHMKLRRLVAMAPRILELEAAGFHK